MQKGISKLALSLGVLALGVLASHVQAHGVQRIALDSDHDGLTDDVEDALLEKFSPTFMISRDDCSVRPAQFIPGEKARPCLPTMGPSTARLLRARTIPER